MRRRAAAGTIEGPGKGLSQNMMGNEVAELCLGAGESNLNDLRQFGLQDAVRSETKG